MTHYFELSPLKLEAQGASEPGKRGGRSGRMGRILGHGGLRLLVLSLLDEQPSHGYELIKAIDGRCNGEYSPSPGVMYPTLTLLEEMGHAVVSSVSGARKQYRITDEGRAFLLQHGDRLAELQGRMERTAAQRPDLPPQAYRALENIRTAVHLRLTRPMSEAQANAFAKVLDDAVQQLEQI